MKEHEHRIRATLIVLEEINGSRLIQELGHMIYYSSKGATHKERTAILRTLRANGALSNFFTVQQKWTRDDKGPRLGWIVEIADGFNTVFQAYKDKVQEYDKEQHQRLYLDTATAILTIDGKAVKLRQDSKMLNLARILFKSTATMRTEHQAAEITHQIDPDIELKAFPDFLYNQARNLNRKIKDQSQLEQVLIYTQKTVRVNPKYLESP